MAAGDLGAVSAVAAVVHPAYPESDAVFAERLRLFPAGCLVLEGDGAVLGYAVAHPWVRAAPPALDTLLGALPAGPGAMLLHDLALLPGARGLGAGREAVRRVAGLAGGLPLALVAVGGTEAFWRRQGFRAVADPALEALLRGYDPRARYMERASGGGRVASSAAWSM